MRKSLYILIMFLCGCACAFAQEAKSVSAPENVSGDSITVFNPHGYLEAFVGVQQTLGEIKTLGLNNLNVQVGGGYRFTPLWGLRLTVGGWTSRAGMLLDGTTYPYKWNYVAPTLNVTFDITNAIWGYKEDRVVSWGIFAGPGLNIAFNNQQADALNQKLMEEHPALAVPIAPMNAVWDGVKAYALGQFGTNVDFRVSQRVRIGLEGNINFVDDRYNSKYVNNIDWYFNFLVGVKVALGKPCKKVAKPSEELLPDTTPVDTVVPAPVDTVVPQPVDTVEEVQEIVLAPQNIFFQINSFTVSDSEHKKLDEVDAFMRMYPDAILYVTGYADHGTGNAEINRRISGRRANEVTRVLIEEYHIDPARIVTDAKGDSVQPFEENDLNRVVICTSNDKK